MDILIGFFIICTIGQAFSNLLFARQDIEALDLREKNYLTALNKQRSEEGLDAIEHNLELADVAQKESERLAKLGRLELPKFYLKKKYIGKSFKIPGMIKATGELLGSVMCYNNIYTEVDPVIYDRNSNLDCKNQKIQFDSDPLLDEIGYGRTAAENGDIYEVKLYYVLDKAPVPISSGSKNVTNSHQGPEQLIA